MFSRGHRGPRRSAHRDFLPTRRNRKRHRIRRSDRACRGRAGASPAHEWRVFSESGVEPSGVEPSSTGPTPCGGATAAGRAAGAAAARATGPSRPAACRGGPRVDDRRTAITATTRGRRSDDEALRTAAATAAARPSRGPGAPPSALAAASLRGPPRGSPALKVCRSISGRSAADAGPSAASPLVAVPSLRLLTAPCGWNRLDGGARSDGSTALEPLEELFQPLLHGARPPGTTDRKFEPGWPKRSDVRPCNLRDVVPRARGEEPGFCYSAKNPERSSGGGTCRRPPSGANLDRRPRDDTNGVALDGPRGTGWTRAVATCWSSTTAVTGRP
jgi:hypothetical protein